MSQSRPGPGGRINFIEPSDLDEEASGMTQTEETRKASRNPLGQRSQKNAHTTQTREPKPPKPRFESTLEPWVMAFKPRKVLGKPKNGVKKPKTGLSPFFVIAYLKWWLYTRLNLMKYEWISPPSTNVSARAEIRENIQYLKDHRQETNAIIVVLAAKGGAAKSSIIQWLAAFIGYYVKSKPALLGLDVGADKTASRFAAPKDKVFSMTLLIELVKQGIPFSAQWLQSHTVTDEDSGVVLFKAKQEGSSIRDFNIEETANTMRYMHQLYPLVFGDNGPGLNMKASDGAAQAAHVALVCNKGISEEALDDIRLTLQLPNYGLAAKQIKPIVVISGVLPRYLNTRTQYEVVATKCHVEPRNVILLPYDRYLDDQRRYNLKRVHIPSLSLKPTLMLSRFAKRVVEAIVESKPANTQSAEEAATRLLRSFIPEQRIENA